MPAKASDFRRGGSFEMGASAVVLTETLRKLCWNYGRLNVRTALDGLPDDPGLPPSAEEEAPEPGSRRARRTQKVTPGKSPTRSAGSYKAWDTRDEIDEYMKKHRVTKEEATRAVEQMQVERGDRPRTRVRAARKNPRRTAWSQDVKKFMEEEQAKGRTLTYREAQHILANREQPDAA
jgi:hypothetical protein